MSSQDNTVISLATQSIVDAQGTAWSIIGGQVAVNGIIDPTTDHVIEMAYEKGLVWQKNADNLWWSKASPTDPWEPPYGTSINPAPGIIPSPTNTVVRTADHAITDASGNTWSILSGQVALNGVPDPTTGNVIELAYENGRIWQENASHLWWSKLRPSDPWGPTFGTPTSPVVVSPTKSWVLVQPYTFGNFLDGQNWTGGIPPQAGDTAFIRSGLAIVSAPTGTGAMGEGGVILYLGSTDPTRTAELETTTNVTLASQMTLVTGASGAASTRFVGNIFAVNSTLTNEGDIRVVAGTPSAELDIRLRYAALVNYGSLDETGAKGVLKVFGTTQYGNSGAIINHGVMTASGGLIDLENPTSGDGRIQVNDNGTVKIGNSFAAGGAITINAGTLEFGQAVVSPNPAWATNPGMQFLSSVTFAASGNPALANALEQIKLDAAWHATSSLSLALSNIQPNMAEMTVSDGKTKILDAKLLGHYDAPEFTLGHTGADVTVMFHTYPLTDAVPHS
jgi:hypothetical protein